jgi:hypothetical protein
MRHLRRTLPLVTQGNGDPRPYPSTRETLQENEKGEIKMAEEKQPHISGLFEDTTKEDEEAKPVAGVIRLDTESNQHNNGKVKAVHDEPTTKQVSYDELNRLEDDSLHRYKTLVAQVNTLQAALGAMRGLVGLSLLVAVYAAFKVRKLSGMIEGGKKVEGKVIEVEEVVATSAEDI